MKILTAGDCREWVQVDKESLNLIPDGVQVKASITVPTDAYNGNYRCAVTYTAPKAGIVTSQIEVPIKIAITGGKDAPVKITEAPTEAPVKPTGTQATLTAPVQPTDAPAGFPDMPFTTTAGMLIAGVIAVVFAVVVVFDYRRGKRQ